MIKSDEDIINQRVKARLYEEERQRLVAERAAQQDLERQQMAAALKARQDAEAWAIERLGQVKELRTRQAALLSQLADLLGQAWEAETEAVKIEAEVGQRFVPYLSSLIEPRRVPYWNSLFSRAGLRTDGKTFLELPAQTPGEKLARLVLRAIAWRPSSVLAPDGILIESGDSRMWFT